MSAPQFNFFHFSRHINSGSQTYNNHTQHISTIIPKAKYITPLSFPSPPLHSLQNRDRRQKEQNKCEGIQWSGLRGILFFISHLIQPIPFCGACFLSPLSSYLCDTRCFAYIFFFFLIKHFDTIYFTFTWENYRHCCAIVGLFLR